ncbi:terminase, partial [Acinetobacter baumannii]
PAQPGELRWFANVNGKEQEVESNKPFVIIDEQIVYDFDPKDFALEDIIKPTSRTFIPARVTDNKYYMETGYMSTLQALPEPLRSQMLYGDFGAGIEDDPWQVIPTEWVEAAQARWKPLDDMRILHRGCLLY